MPVLRSHTRLEGYTSNIHLHLILGRECLSVPARSTRIARAIIFEGGTSSLRMLGLDEAPSSLPLLTNDTVRKNGNLDRIQILKDSSLASRLASTWTGF